MQSLRVYVRSLLAAPTRLRKFSSFENVPSEISRRRKWNKHGFRDEESKYLSVDAYNVCEEFRLDRLPSVLSSLSSYQNVKLPPDSMNQVVHLQSKEQLDKATQGQDDTISSIQSSKDIYLFDKGSAVFWNVSNEEQRTVLSALNPLKVHPYSDAIIEEESEQLDYTYDAEIERSRLSKGNIVLSAKISARQLEQFAFSHAIALSVKLGIWESLLDEYIRSIGWVTNCMKSGSKINLTRDQVFRKTGELFELKHQLNLNSELLDTPDFYWDRQDLEDIFTKTISYMNVRKRTSVMNEKLNHCYELMDLLSSHMNDKHHVRLEWMIIVLIMVEVLFEITHFL